jgi:putative flavoprotein involved in K+ transport
MDAAGVLDDPYDEADNLQRVRSLPSLQLTGSDDRHTLDLNYLTDLGVRLVGRLAGIRDGRALFSGSLRNQCALSDLKMNRLLDRIDEWTEAEGLDGEVEPPHRLAPTRVEKSPLLGLHLRSGEIRTVVWATGFRPDYAWLDVPVFDRKGRLIHDGGVVAAPGLYVLGLPYLRRLRSSLIDGAAGDAEFLGAHLAEYLDGDVAPASTSV